MLQGQGSVLALDIGRSRLTALRRMAARQQHGAMVSTHAADLREFASLLARRRRLAAAGGGEAAQQAQQGPGEAAEAEAAGVAGSDASDESAEDAGDSRRRAWPTEFDRVLLDAPCSGTGVLAKRADLRWRRTPEEVEQMAGLQGQLLAAAGSERVGMGLWGGTGAGAALVCATSWQSTISHLLCSALSCLPRTSSNPYPCSQTNVQAL